jgi:hypothetical protein
LCQPKVISCQCNSNVLALCGCNVSCCRFRRQVRYDRVASLIGVDPLGVARSSRIHEICGGEEDEHKEHDEKMNMTHKSKANTHTHTHTHTQDTHRLSSLSRGFMSQEHRVPHDGPKDSNAGAIHVRSRSQLNTAMEASRRRKAQCTTEGDTELYPGSGLSW